MIVKISIPNDTAADLLDDLTVVALKRLRKTLKANNGHWDHPDDKRQTKELLEAVKAILAYLRIGGN